MEHATCVREHVVGDKVHDNKIRDSEVLWDGGEERKENH
jgi:hypothetical protein